MWSQGIAGLLGIFTQDVAAVGTYLEGVLACLCQPTAVGFVKRGKVSLLHLDGQCLTLTGFQFTGLGKTLQLVLGLLDGTLGGCHVNLGNLLTCHTARILNSDADGDIVAIHLDGWLAIFKSGIAETVTEGIGHIAVERVEETVTHVDIFLVIGVGMS